MREREGEGKDKDEVKCYVKCIVKQLLFHNYFNSIIYSLESSIFSQRLVTSRLDQFVASELRPDQAFHKEVKADMKFLNQFLRNQSGLPVAEVKKVCGPPFRYACLNVPRTMTIFLAQIPVYVKGIKISAYYNTDQCF